MRQSRSKRSEMCSGCGERYWSLVVPKAWNYYIGLPRYQVSIVPIVRFFQAQGGFLLLSTRSKCPFSKYFRLNNYHKFRNISSTLILPHGPCLHPIFKIDYHSFIPILQMIHTPFRWLSICPCLFIAWNNRVPYIERFSTRIKQQLSRSNATQRELELQILSRKEEVD